MTLCRWSPCLSLHLCNRCGKDVITHRISLRIFWIHSKLSVFNSPIDRTCFRVRCFRRNRNRSSLALLGHASAMASWRPWQDSRVFWKQCNEKFHGNLCCVSICSKHHCTWRREAISVAQRSSWFSVFRRRRVFLEHLAASFQATSEARYTKYSLSDRRPKDAKSGMYSRDY